MASVYGQTSDSDTLRLTLEACLEYAFRNSYGRQSQKLSETAKEELYEQGKMERFPSLSASVGENLSHTRGSSAEWSGSYGISTGMTLYQGGQINQSIRQNKLTAEQAGYQSTQYDNNLIIQILQNFLTALGNEELLKYQQTVLCTSAEQAKQGREFFRVGQILESDYLLLEAQLATDSSNVLETGINRDNNLSLLKVLLSIDPGMPLRLVYPDTALIRTLLVLPEEGYVLERSLNASPELQISAYDVRIAETGLKIVRSAYYPSLNLNGSIGTGHNDDFSGFGNQLRDRLNEQIGATLSIPVFNRNRTRSNVIQSKIALEQAELNRKQVELDVRQSILQEYRDVVVSAGKYRSSEIRQEAYFRSFEVYKALYRAGSITTTDLLQQQNSYINAINEYIQNKYGFILKRKILDVYMGEYSKI